jgi:hypothetical protein
MYIVDPSPDELLVFLWGYMLAMDDAGLEDKSEPAFQVSMTGSQSAWASTNRQPAGPK